LIWFSSLLPGAAGTVALAGCASDEAPTWSEIENEREEEPRDLGPPQRIFAKRFVAPIRDTPSPTGTRIGYLRAGVLLHSTTTEPLAYEGCESGWYALDTGGYACNGRDIIVFSGEKLPELRARQPDREAVMPYEYATVGGPTPVYKRLPTASEVYEIPPETLDAGIASPSEDQGAIDHPLVVRILEPGFYVSLDRTFTRDGETYWRTQQNGFVSARHLQKRRSSEFKGRELDAQTWDLPVALTRRDGTVVYRLNEREKLRATRERLARRVWLRVSARRLIEDRPYLVVGDGKLVREEDALVIQPSAPPEQVTEGERWIDIDLAHQVLVAYEWRQPRYVTLVSTGRREKPSPDVSYETPKGLYRIRSKHVTSTMDNNEPGEPPYSLEDVPYVMYFNGAYALHAAFWHDRFGRPRSHGCINLAPRDAKWLYRWAAPDLPEGWHGGYSTEANPGTWVHIHGDTPRR
jgi:hypothetical protein